jgi:hypothetical protein
MTMLPPGVNIANAARGWTLFEAVPRETAVLVVFVAHVFHRSLFCLVMQAWSELS